jgi:hypothetical protein
VDKLKCKVFNYLWCIWHMRLRSFFDRFAPPCLSCRKAMVTLRELANEGYAPAQREVASFHCYHAKYILTSRPWWHVCCNGDAGGWRTHVCDWLEHKWRSTRYYSEG